MSDASVRLKIVRRHYTSHLHLSLVRHPVAVRGACAARDAEAAWQSARVATA